MQPVSSAGKLATGVNCRKTCNRSQARLNVQDATAAKCGERPTGAKRGKTCKVQLLPRAGKRAYNAKPRLVSFVFTTDWLKSSKFAYIGYYNFSNLQTFYQQKEDLSQFYVPLTVDINIQSVLILKKSCN